MIRGNNHIHSHLTTSEILGLAILALQNSGWPFYHLADLVPISEKAQLPWLRELICSFGLGSEQQISLRSADSAELSRQFQGAQTR
jgi:hypothetical protein